MSTRGARVEAPRGGKVFNFLNENGVFWWTLEHCFKVNVLATEAFAPDVHALRAREGAIAESPLNTALSTVGVNNNKRLCNCRGTARRATSVEILWPFFD